MLTLHVIPQIARFESMAAFFDFRLSIRGPLPVLSRAAWLLSQTMFEIVKSIGETSELAVSISVIASLRVARSFQIAAGALCATMA